MTEQQIKQALLDALRDLRDNGPLFNRGICSEVEWRLGIVKVRGPVPLLDALMVRWPEFSGSEDFPVPAPDRTCAVQAFYYLERWTGPYGDSRRRLLAFCIDTLEAELANEEAAHE